MSMWVQGLATDKVVELDRDTLDIKPRPTLRDIDQQELADALMACALACVSPDEVSTLKAGYALALQRERITAR